MSVVIKRLLKLSKEQLPTRRKRVAKKELPALKAEQFISKKREKTARELATEASLKDRLLKSQYDAADAKLNARAKRAKADFIEMNIGDTPERRAVREAKEALQVAKKAEPSTQQLLLEYLRDNEATTRKAVRSAEKLSTMLKIEQDSRKQGGRPAGSKNIKRRPSSSGESVPAGASVPALESAITLSAIAPAPAPVVVGSPASTITGVRVSRKLTDLQKEQNKQARIEAKRLANRSPEILLGASAGAPTPPVRKRSLPIPKVPSVPVAKASAQALALDSDAGEGSGSDTDTGKGFNQALIGKGEQLKAGKNKVYMSETKAHLETLNNYNRRVVIPKNDIVDVERFLNTSLENRAIPIRNIL